MNKCIEVIKILITEILSYRAKLHSSAPYFIYYKYWGKYPPMVLGERGKLGHAFFCLLVFPPNTTIRDINAIFNRPINFL